MFLFGDNDLSSYENQFVRVDAYSYIGDRSEQQDSSGFVYEDKTLVAAVSDGMGGHACGQLASRTAISTILNQLSFCEENENINTHIRHIIMNANKAICGFQDDDGLPIYAGATLALVYICDKKLYWVSAGDSRIYLLRNDILSQITVDHTIVQDGVKTASSSDVLSSFLGVGQFPSFCGLDNSIELFAKDQILIVTDGIHKLLSNDELQYILVKNKNTTNQLSGLKYKLVQLSNILSIPMDNNTGILISIL